MLADRYVYTAFARDGARGMDPAYIRKVYDFAVRPTVAFYFRVPLKESLQRIMVGRPTLKYYEAGMDLGLHPDPYESFKLFQGRILEIYDSMIDEYGQRDEHKRLVRPSGCKHLGQVDPYRQGLLAPSEHDGNDVS